MSSSSSPSRTRGHLPQPLAKALMTCYPVIAIKVNQEARISEDR